MKKQKRLRTGFVVIAVVVVAIVTIRHFTIRDFCVIESGILYTSDQPRGMDYSRLLYNYHIATIVNVRPTREHREENWRSEEVVWARSNAVRYLEMPIEKDSYFPNEQTQVQFLAIMADKNNLPVLLHGSGDDKRVAMLVAVWLRQSQGYSAQETAGAVRKIIDDRELTDKELRFISDPVDQNPR